MKKKSKKIEAMKSHKKLCMLYPAVVNNRTYSSIIRHPFTHNNPRHNLYPIKARSFRQEKKAKNKHNHFPTAYKASLSRSSFIRVHPLSPAHFSFRKKRKKKYAKCFARRGSAYKRDMEIQEIDENQLGMKLCIKCTH